MSSFVIDDGHASGPAGMVRYLPALHSVEWRVPGWRKVAARTEPLLLAAGDPIYNRADPRAWRPAIAGVSWFRSNGPEVAAAQLNRLAGSREEVEGAAAAWREAGGTARVLVGKDVTAAQIRNALAANPRVIHLATHVVPGSKPGQALLALGLNQTGEFEVWTPQDIAGLRVAGALVVLSGCHSAQGDPVAGADLLGLGRAWLRAGASAVVLTSWPVEDEQGRMWKTFYGELPVQEQRFGPGARAAAVALQRAQGEMGRATEWADPRRWAGVQVVGRN